MRLSFLLPVLVLHNCCCSHAQIKSASFCILLDEITSPFPHVWEESVGSGHFALGLRADWRAQLTRARADIGFKRVRMHGMLDDDTSVSLGPPTPHSQPPVPGGYSFVSLNSVIDFLASIGMDAFFEVGFMPRWLAMNASATVMHYGAITSPPRNYTEWAQVIEHVARHLYNRYGGNTVAKWYFEVWNEPNIHFWTGFPQQDTYFQLYRETFNAFRRVSSHFHVGGPATSGQGTWFPEFLEYCNTSGVGPPDFVSTHWYAGGDKGSIYNDGTQAIEKIHEMAQGIPVAITEYGGSWAHMPQLDEPSYAAFIVSTAARTQNLTNIMSLWAFSDVFEETGFPAENVTYSAGFGLMNVYGIPKPSYRAMQLLHWAGENRVQVAREDGACTTADVLALQNSTHLGLFVTNHAPLPLEGEDTVEACVVHLHVGDSVGPARMARIDDDHVNPKKAWEAMGYPKYPTPEEIVEMEAASELRMQPLRASTNGTLSLRMPRGLAAIFMPLKSKLLVQKSS